MRLLRVYKRTYRIVLVDVNADSLYTIRQYEDDLNYSSQLDRTAHFMADVWFVRKN